MKDKLSIIIKVQRRNKDMEKAWYLSKTKWGSILLGLEGVLLTLPIGNFYVEAVLVGLGVILVGWGIRDAL